MRRKTPEATSSDLGRGEDLANRRSEVSNILRSYPCCRLFRVAPVLPSADW